ncbi:MAG TPA: hypothetical protein VJ438_05350 [Candidatus Nanoarchaeia archaeon]|nr:hypothetical protein [Candidatus Nanoarchaeia archaeon]
MQEFTKEIKELEEKLGIKAYNEITKILWHMQRKIEDLEVSRENWRDKYLELEKKLKKEVKR